MFLNVTGSNNVASGFRALYANDTGSSNTATGWQAMYSNTNGSFNVGDGYKALWNNITGTLNTAIGYNANVSGGAYTDATAVGSNAVATASHMVRIGDANVTVIQGQVPYTNPSDGRFKYNIKEEDVKGLDFIMRLRPVVYNFDTRKYEEFVTAKMSAEERKSYLDGKDFSASSAIRQSGFIAQEVEQAMNATGYDFNGLHKPANENDNYGVAYSQFVVPLVKAVQEQQTMIETQKAAIEELKKQNALMMQEIEELKKK
jgi:hypothetical protein